MIMRFVLCFLLWLNLGPSQALAEDSGLYPDAIDPNSAFLRVFAPGLGDIKISGKRIQTTGPGLSVFVTVPSGESALRWPQGRLDTNIEAGQHMTLMLDEAGHARFLVPPFRLDPAKSIVQLANLSQLDGLALYVPRAKAYVFKDLAPSAAVGHSLRAPLTLDFELRHKGEVIARAPQVALVRNNSVLFLVLPQGEGVMLHVIEGRYAR